MTKENIIILAVTVLLYFISIGSIKFTPFRKAEGAKAKLNCLVKSTWKETLYFVLIFAVNIALCEMLLLFYKDNTVIHIIKRIALVSVLWVAAYFDKKSYRVPNKLILLGFAFRLIILAAELFTIGTQVKYTVISELIAAAAMFVISLVCILIAKNSLGMGDVKLFLIMGLLLGVQGIMTAMFYSLIITFFVSVFMLITRKKNRKDFLPFAPSILVGTVLAIALSNA